MRHYLAFSVLRRVLYPGCMSADRKDRSVAQTWTDSATAQGSFRFEIANDRSPYGIGELQFPMRQYFRVADELRTRRMSELIPLSLSCCVSRRHSLLLTAL